MKAASWVTFLSLTVALMLLCCPPAEGQTCGTPPSAKIVLPAGEVEVQNAVSTLPGGGNSGLNIRGQGFTFNISYWPTGTNVNPLVNISVSNKWSAFAFGEPGAIYLMSFYRADSPVDLSVLKNSHPEHADLWKTMIDVTGELVASQEFWNFMNLSEDQKSDLVANLTDVAEGYYAPEMRSEILGVTEMVAPNYHHDMQILYGFTIQGGSEPREISVWDGGDNVIYIDVDGRMPVDRYHLTIYDNGCGTVDSPMTILWDAGDPACPLTSEELWSGIISEIRYTLWDVGGKQILNPNTNPSLHYLLLRASGSFGRPFPELNIVYPSWDRKNVL